MSSQTTWRRAGNASMEEVEEAVFGDFVPVEAIEVCSSEGGAHHHIVEAIEVCSSEGGHIIT